jgi:hypothetical protein
MEIRPARADELAALPALEVAAGALFREIGMTRIRSAIVALSATVLLQHFPHGCRGASLTLELWP